MNFLDKINEDLNEPRNLRGMRDKVCVDSRALRELLRVYEQIDSERRVLNTDHCVNSLHRLLHETITAVYHQQGKGAETTLLIIMQTLQPLMEKQRKDNERTAKANYYR